MIIKSSAIIFLCYLVIGCTNEPQAQITFCEGLDQQGDCVGDQNEFALGEVYLKCQNDKPFKTRSITGKIFKLRKGEPLLVTTKIFPIESGENSITYSIPFNNFGPDGTGNFKIEFVTEEGSVLASKELTILPLSN